MSYWKKVSLWFIGSLALFASSIILALPEKFNLCQYNDVSCVNDFGAIAEPIFFLSISLVLVFFALFFVRESVFRVWKKFAIIYLPLALILIFTTPVTPGFMQMGRELMSLWTAGIFLVASLAIVAWKSWSFRINGGNTT